MHQLQSSRSDWGRGFVHRSQRLGWNSRIDDRSRLRRIWFNYVSMISITPLNSLASRNFSFSSYVSRAMFSIDELTFFNGKGLPNRKQIIMNEPGPTVESNTTRPSVVMAWIRNVICEIIIILKYYTTVFRCVRCVGKISKYIDFLIKWCHQSSQNWHQVSNSAVE